MATFAIPQTLKATQLKLLATKCGLLTTGTKPILLSRLHDEITSSSKYAQNRKTTTRILSIDMGIRNLAYCILDVPPQKPKQAAKPLPILQSWHRLSVSKAPVSNPDDEVVAKEVFDPATLSTIAYTLLRKRLLAMKPHVVLIERQRFRSMGSKHILEWTVRVNMFESILYATLHTLKQEGIWEGEVVPVIPGKVGPFWIGEDVNEGVSEDIVAEKGKGKTKKLRNSKNAKVKNKGAKIDLVRGWCGSGDMVKWGNMEVEDMASAYMEKWDRRPGGLKGPKKGPKKDLVEGQEKMGKLDDLADCLLQGMAWVQWEENKRRALDYGAESLLEP